MNAMLTEFSPGNLGSTASTDSVDWVTCDFLSRQKPSADQSTSCSATKFRSSVVMISLTPQYALARAGTRIHAAPAIDAARAIRMISSQCGASTLMPTPTAAKAPIRN
ncbi:unannotated protein [freshwater metagenome]|uniref:Unannotated protein n=1 Tax=freshwater metagenome TaxID=449393 RepID=A0A6J7UM71_9ZZZZ